MRKVRLDAYVFESTSQLFDALAPCDTGRTTAAHSAASTRRQLTTSATAHVPSTTGLPFLTHTICRARPAPPSQLRGAARCGRAIVPGRLQPALPWECRARAHLGAIGYPRPDWGSLWALTTVYVRQPPPPYHRGAARSIFAIPWERPSPAGMTSGGSSSIPSCSAPAASGSDDFVFLLLLFAPLRVYATIHILCMCEASASQPHGA